MEFLSVTTHADGGEKYLHNLFRYLCDDRMILGMPYGVNAKAPKVIEAQFKLVASCFGNRNKNLVIHYMLSLSKEIAPNEWEAMYLLNEVFEPLTADHLVLIVVHKKEHLGSLYHGHVVVSTTNFIDGSFLSHNNKLNFMIAQRVADITGEECRLAVDFKSKKGQVFFKEFKPSSQDN